MAAAALAMLVYFILACLSVRHKSLTADESLHLVGGLSYWTLHDYRINPENGNLPQRWAALPLIATAATPLDTQSQYFHSGSFWRFADEYLYTKLVQPLDQIFRARCTMALLGVLLLGLIYCWSKRLWGARGAAFSVAMAAFSPNLIANGRLITSDMAQCLTYLAACWMLWLAIKAPGAVRILLAGLIVGLACVSKFSAALLAPVALIFLAIQTWRGRGQTPDNAPRPWHPIAAAGALAGIGLIAYGVIWAAYGFSYSAFNPQIANAQFYEDWSTVVDGESSRGQLILFLRDFRLFPEAFIHGLAHVLSFADARQGYLMGEIRSTGWWYFFPVAVLIKTPLPVFAALLAALIGRWRTPPEERRGQWEWFIPLAVGVAVYWLIVIQSNLNIGVRHVLLTFPFFYILLGGAAIFPAKDQLTSRRTPWLGMALPVLLLGWQILGTLAIHPHYLTFFNLLVGGPGQGNHYLVDSSLDWGQDLPSIKQWVDRKHQTEPGAPVYLNFFGRASPEFHGIDAHPLNYPPDHIGEFSIPPLKPGYYLFSATHFRGVSNPLSGPWTRDREVVYRDAIKQVRKLMRNPDDRRELLAAEGSRAWLDRLLAFQRLRTERLRQFLQDREPDGLIANTILIYKLDEESLREYALEPDVGIEDSTLIFIH